MSSNRVEEIKKDIDEKIEFLRGMLNKLKK